MNPCGNVRGPTCMVNVLPVSYTVFTITIPAYCRRRADSINLIIITSKMNQVAIEHSIRQALINFDKKLTENHVDIQCSQSRCCRVNCTTWIYLVAGSR
ncbi:hypothetical protein BO94DRAFT_393929 [Aspergillus sclerotioniger CBS 115572]|uniref:Uncharacterized protein n=1 Tax=Aspergillus sclerotioniger CBS 115572 TaxID=1450535 RepID=A0A317WYH9_9EURO|nr:hypothetical protein BO94DRAFT_393929 [Aspergillus sclerotioniger CBS 115572]PWY91454.1 hypothetical protein BO94DRAFT_393929 [Aspergillus sclerotioniger CBS 115572]